jgi:hypothetical protein
LAFEAFRLDLVCLSSPPPFHAFYLQEPGLFESWRDAWVQTLVRWKLPWKSIPPKLVECEQVVELWFQQRVDDARRGRGPEQVPSGVRMRDAWRRLWLIAVTAALRNLGPDSNPPLPPEKLKEDPETQEFFFTGWKEHLRRILENTRGARVLPTQENQMVRMVRQLRERFGPSRMFRQCAFEYLRMGSEMRVFPILKTLSRENEVCTEKKAVLAACASDPAFQGLWKEAWEKAGIRHLSDLSRGATWRSFYLPDSVAKLPQLRCAARNAYGTFLRLRSTIGGTRSPAPQSVDLERALDPSTCPDPGLLVAEKSVSAVSDAAHQSAMVFLEKMALNESLTELETPSDQFADKPECIDLREREWPLRVADFVPAECLSSAIGSSVPETSPAEAWTQPAAQRVYRAIVLRFFLSRGPGHPLLTKDAIPKSFASDPEMQEAWISAWERVVTAMPREYAVYRRIALSVQDSPRVFQAWLRAVQPLERLLEEEEAWRHFCFFTRERTCLPCCRILKF